MNWFNRMFFVCIFSFFFSLLTKLFYSAFSSLNVNLMVGAISFVNASHFPWHTKRTTKRKTTTTKYRIDLVAVCCWPVEVGQSYCSEGVIRSVEILQLNKYNDSKNTALVIFELLGSILRVYLFYATLHLSFCLFLSTFSSVCTAFSLRSRFELHKNSWQANEWVGNNAISFRCELKGKS